MGAVSFGGPIILGAGRPFLKGPPGNYQGDPLFEGVFVWPAHLFFLPRPNGDRQQYCDDDRVTGVTLFLEDPIAIRGLPASSF